MDTKSAYPTEKGGYPMDSKAGYPPSSKGYDYDPPPMYAPPPMDYHQSAGSSSRGPPQPPSKQRFTIVKPVIGRHYEVNAENGPTAFTADISEFRPGKPDLTLMQGDGRSSSATVACAHFPKISRSYKVGLAANGPGSNMVFEEMRSERFTKHEYSFSAPTPGGQRRTFLWKKTSHSAPDGMRPKYGGSNFKLVDPMGGDELVAVFSKKHGMSTCGVLQINVDFGPQFDYMVVITLLSLYESIRRNASAAGGGAAGGGSA